MAIHILYGPGGAGKSYYQTRRIIEELRRTRRNIVTNLSLNVPRLAEYLEQTHGDSFNVHKRVRLLTEDETKTFWKFRGPLVPKPVDLMEPCEVWESVLVQDEGKLGCLFVIDEAGVAGFSASGWATSEGRSTRGQECSWYLDQQRKFSDDVYASCNGRHPAGIAKPFRDKAHVFIRLKNGYLQKWGVFKGRGRFLAEHYTHEPSSNSEPFMLEPWTMDAAGVGSCYRTQDGVGVHGVSADIGKRARGIPILAAIPMAIAFALVVAVGIPMLLAKGVQRYTVKQGEEKKAKVAAVAEGKKAERGEKSGLPAGGGSGTVEVKRGSENLTSNAGPVTVRGIVRSGNRVNVMLSDGRVLTEAEPFLRIERGWVESPQGVRYNLARIEPKPQVAPNPAAGPSPGFNLGGPSAEAVGPYVREGEVMRIRDGAEHSRSFGGSMGGGGSSGSPSVVRQSVQR